MSTTIITADVFDGLAQIDADSIDCVVTSPPYWGLRSYLADDHQNKSLEIGCEPTLAEHLDVLVRVCREIRRVLKPEGTFWLNYGDCYATAPNGRSAADTKNAGRDNRTFRDKPFSTVQGFLKPKDLCLVPYRLAIALQEDGWWVRSDITWGKPNAMPDSSGRYRPSTSHEKIFLLTKTGKCFYDSEAVRMPVSGNTNSRGTKKSPPIDSANIGHNNWSKYMNRDDEIQANGRLLRNYEPDLSRIIPPEVWHIPIAGFSGAHFATFPPALASVCIMAGCPEGGVVLDPFGGAGTTAMVADRMGRDAILIELNEDSVEITKDRLHHDAGMFSEVLA